jgi:lysyl-tRNA synthetase class 2
MVPAYGDYFDSMNLFEEVVEQACLDVHQTTEVIYGDVTLNFKRPWKRLRMAEAIQQKTDLDVTIMKKDDIILYMKTNNIVFDPKIAHSKGLLVANLFEEVCEPDLIQPVFVYDFPIDTTPLCKPLVSIQWSKLEKMKMILKR